MNKKPILVLLRQLPQAVINFLSAHFEVRVEASDYTTRPLNLSLYKDASILLSTAMDTVPSSFIKQLPATIKLIANIGVGFNAIDIKQAAIQGIKVTNTPGAMNDEVANLTMALIVNVSRKLNKSEHWLRSGSWDEKINPDLVGTSITGQKLGLIGFGGIGREVARRAQAFKLNTSFYKPSPLAEGIDAFGAVYQPDLDQLIEESDIISLHCPLTKATEQLISQDRLIQMKNTAILINTSRGRLVNEKALVKALESGIIKGAGLDVFENEPEVHPQLKQLENVFLTPHIGSATVECRQKMFQMAIGNVQSFLTTGKVMHPVN